MKFIETLTFSGTLKDFTELQNSAGYLLLFRADFQAKTPDIKGLFGDNISNEKILLIGFKRFNEEVKPQLYGKT